MSARFRWTVLSLTLVLLAVAFGWLARPTSERTAAREAPASEASGALAAPPTLGVPARPPTPFGVPTSPQSPAPPVVGWRVVGTVKEPDGTPVAGAEVWLTLHLYRSDRTLGSVATDAEGRFSIAAPALDELDPRIRSTSSVFAIATAARHRASAPVLKSVPPGDRPGEVSFEVVLFPGASLTGRVLDSAAQPVASANVRLCSSPSEQKHAYTHSRTDALGRFALPIATSGTFGLDAEKLGLGVAVSAALELDPTRDAVVPDLVLKGEGWIEGKAVYPDGSPAAWLHVGASPPKSATAAESEGCPSESLGQTLGQATSDAQGHFRISGLKPGRYDVAHSTAIGGHEPYRENLCTTGDANAIIICRCHRLLLRAIDEAGHPVPGAEYHLHGVGPTLETTEDGIFFGADAIDPIEVGPDMKVTVTASAPDLRSDEASFVIEPDHFETTFSLVLKPGRTPAARLHMEVSAPDGTPITPYRVEVEPVMEGAGSYSTIEFGPDEGDRSPPLKPGKYFLTIHPGRGAPGSRLEFYVSESLRVEVKDGETRSVPVHARSGGRVRVVLRERGAQLAELRNVTFHPGASGRYVNWSPYDFVSLSATATRLQDFPPDTPIVGLDALEPGGWTIRIAAKGIRPFEKLVEIEAGKLVDVELLAEPE